MEECYSSERHRKEKQKSLFEDNEQNFTENDQHSHDICNNNNLECYENKNNFSKDKNEGNLIELHSTTFLMRQFTRILH